MNEQPNAQVAISTPTSATNKSSPRRGVWTAIGLLLTGLIVTALAFRYTKSHEEAEAKGDFELVCNEIQTKIVDRLHAHEQILRSAAAFYEHSNSITRKEWCSFAQRQKFEQQLPGIQGIGFALLIPRQQLAQHVQKIRAEGFPEYHIRPEGQRETYSSVIYLEPFTGRNLRAFGYDMLTEPVRRKAMERAGDEDAATLSGKVVLVQETDKEIQAGTLMYVPVYRKEMPHETVARRRAAILGWVYSPYRMNDLMQGILGGLDVEGGKRIRLEAFDGGEVSPETLLYDSQSAEGNERQLASALALQTSIDSAGHRWTLRFTQCGSLAAAVDYGKVWLVLFAGTSVSLLLFGLSLALLNTRFKASRIAQKLTAEYERVGALQQEALGRLQKIASRVPGLIYEYRLRPDGSGCGSMPFASDAIRELFRVSPKEVREDASKLFANLHPDDYANTDASIQASARDLTLWQHEFRVKFVDGTIRVLYGNAVPQREEDGSVLWHGFIIDVTEQRESERRQSLSAEVLGILNDPHELSDAISRILAAIQRTTGFDAVGIRLRNGDDFPYYSQNGFSADFLRVENTLMVRDRAGGPCRDKNGNISLECTCGLVLSEQTDPASPLFTTGGSFWTNNSLPLLELSADQDPRLHPRNRCIHEGFCSVALIPIRADHKIVGLLQLNDRKKDRFTDEIIRYYEGISASIGVALMRKRAEDDLLQAKAELQEYAAILESNNHALEELNQVAESATRAKSEFLANMSHEIRTPMTAILGFADILLNEEGLEKAPPHRFQAIETIKRNGDHLLGLINDILDLSKVEAGKMQIEPTRCSPCELLAEVVSLMRVRADAKQLKLEVEMASPVPETIFTDPLRLRQVLVNLVSNAIKFTDRGEVRIVVRLTTCGAAVPAALRFDVTDTGIGMNEEQIGKLFQAFSQVDNSATRKFGGTGLGLCISKRLTAAMGGKIEVHSTPGKGSTFSVTIDPGPLDGIRMIQNAQESLFKRPPKPTAAHLDEIKLSGRILLAEDGPDNQRLIAFVLRKAGAEVTLAENGQIAHDEAKAALAQGAPFDVILMDMQMPVMDGYEATRCLRSEGYTGPILALTAHAMAEDRQKCLDAGCDDFGTKPIDRQKLLTTVAHWMKPSQTNELPKLTEDPAARESNASSTMPSAFIYSQMAADPDLGELVDLFVQEMPDRINALETHAQSHDWQQLTRTAHQMKGAAGSYGFSEITPSAARLEAAAKNGTQEEEILSTLDELLSLCRCVRAGVPQTSPSPRHLKR